MKSKIRLVVTFCFVIYGIVIFAQDIKGFFINDCPNINLTINNENNILNAFRLDKKTYGPIQVHPFTLDDVRGWNSFLSSLNHDSDISFEYVDSESSLMFEGIFHRYQQYFKGVLVEGGGFSILTNPSDVQAIQGPPCLGCPPIGPCDLIEMISPNIYENINIHINASISQNELPTLLNTTEDDIIEVSKQIINLRDINCSYKLVWIVKFRDNKGGPLIAKIDAITGEIIFQTPLKLFKKAPIRINNSGAVTCTFLNDANVNNMTFLMNNKIKVYDEDFPDSQVGWANHLIPSSPKDRPWNCVNDNCVANCVDASLPAYELFYNGDRIVTYLAEHYNINLTNVNLAFNKQTDNAYIVLDNIAEYNNSFFVFGINPNTGNPYTNLEIVGHELAHLVLLKYLTYTDLSSASLHEGLADIFSIYLQYKINGFYNWIMGEGVSTDPRNLIITPNNCVSTFYDGIDPHDAGEALGHWYYLLVNGSPTHNINSINQDILFDLILESLKSLGTNTPSWNDLMRATLSNAERKFGTCSPHYLSIVKAWDKICVPTGVGVPCANIEGPNVVCEESNQINICLTPYSGLNFETGTWTILGQNSTSFMSLRGMEGNAQYGGSCLNIIDIPKFSYYPQTISIIYNNSLIGKQISKKVKIIDCDHDDPTCGEYFGLSDASMDVEESTESRNSNVNNQLKLIIYDIVGNVVNTSMEQIKEDYKGIPQLLILTYWNNKGELVKSSKVIKY